MKLVELKWDDAITNASPHPYVLATTTNGKGKDNIIGLGWWTICSWEPPMMAIAVGTRRFSRECLDSVPEFVVCLLPEQQAKGAWICGTKSGRKVDKFSEAGFTKIPSLKVRPPTIGESILAFECKVKNKVETGDHILYIGEVVAIRGVLEQKSHLYSIHYRKLIGISPDGKISYDLEFK